MKRKFVTNLALVIFLNILVKPFWIFGIDRTVQNLVGSDVYGFYFSLFSFSILLNILLDLGITNFNNRNIARDPGKLPEFFSSIVGLRFLLAIFYAIVCLGGGLLMGYGVEHFRLLWILILNQFLASFVLYLRSNISGLHYFRTDSLISVLDRTLVIIICGFLLWGNVTDRPFRIEWFVLAQTAAYGITGIVAFLIVLYRAKYFRLRIDIRKCIAILKESYPFAILILLMFFYYRIDSVLLERILDNGKQQVGIYAQSFRILDAAYMFATLFAGLLLPIFSRMLKKKESIEGMVSLSLTLILLPSLLLASLGVFYSKEIIGLLYNEHTEASSRIFPLLMLAFTCIAISHIFGTLLTANRNLRELNLLAASAFIINLLLNLFLIPRQQAYGAAIACLSTQAYMAVGQIIISAVVIRLRLPGGFILRILLAIPMIIAAGYFTSNYLGNWYLGIGLLTVWTGVVAFSLRLVRFSDLLRILPQE
ncbi:oligosaccharide flippase family protein [Bacteroidota bacterium]